MTTRLGKGAHRMYDVSTLVDLWRAYRIEGFLHCRHCYGMVRLCGQGQLAALKVSLGCRLQRNWT